MSSGSPPDPLCRRWVVTHHDVATEWFRTTYRAGDLSAYQACIDSVGRSPDLAGDPLVEDFVQVADRVCRMMSDLPPVPAKAGHESMDIARRLTEAPLTRMTAATAVLLVELETLDGSIEAAERLVGVLEALAESGESDDLRIHAFIHLAMITAAQNDRSATLQHLRVGLERAVSANSSIRAMVASDLAIELWRQGRGPEALEVMRDVARSLPGNAALVSSTWSFFLLGYVGILFETGHWEEALRWTATLRQSTGMALTVGTSHELRGADPASGRAATTKRVRCSARCSVDDEMSLDLVLVNVGPRLDLDAHLGDTDAVRAHLSKVLAHPTTDMYRAEVMQKALVAARFLLDRSIGDVHTDDVTALKEFAERMANGTALIDAHAAEIAALVGDLSGNSDASDLAGGGRRLGRDRPALRRGLRAAATRGALVAEDDRSRATKQLSAVQEIADLAAEPVVGRPSASGGTGPRRASCGPAAPVASGAGPLTGRELEVLGLLTLGTEQPGDRRATLHVSPDGECPRVPDHHQARCPQPHRGRHARSAIGPGGPSRG